MAWGGRAGDLRQRACISHPLRQVRADSDYASVPCLGKENEGTPLKPPELILNNFVLFCFFRFWLGKDRNDYLR